MKCVVIACLVAAVVAEPPRFRNARFRSQRQELAPTTTDSPTEPTTESAPYHASGWKPAQPFTLPQETPNNTYGAPQVAPNSSYGAPQIAPYPASGWKPDQPFTLPKQQELPSTSYGVPDNSYGPPENAYGAPERDTTENPQAEKLDGAVEVKKVVGEYYVLLPNGLLQKVEFATENDVQNMAYKAQLRFGDRAPLFLFRP